MAVSANIVDLILAKPFESLPYEEKLRIKQQGRSTPKIDLVQKIGKSNRSLSSLALLAIERTLVKSLEKTSSWYNRVTEHFLEKEHRAEFTYK